MQQSVVRRSTAKQMGASTFVSWALSQLPRGEVLNIGSGYPSTEVEGREVSSLDHDWKVLRGAMRSAAGDAAALPFRDATFDGVLLKDVLEHVADPFAVMEDAARVCRHDARVIVTVPRAIPRAVWADPTHLRGFTRDSLIQCLEAGGWVITRGPQRLGSIPGAGRLGWGGDQLLKACSIPGFGHRFGTNWFVEAQRR